MSILLDGKSALEVSTITIYYHLLCFMLLCI